MKKIHIYKLTLKIKIEQHNLLLKIYPKEIKILCWWRNVPCFIASLFTTAKMYHDGWMDTEEVGSVYPGEYYFSSKEEDILPFVKTWVELDGIMPSKISLTETNTVWS